MLGSVSPVALDFGERPVHYGVHRFVTGEFVTKTLVTVQRDVRQDDMGVFVIEYAVLDV